MRLVVIVLLMFLADFTSYSQIEKEYSKKKIIITKSDTIEAYFEYQEDYTGKIKYKLNLDDSKFKKIRVNEIEHLIMGEIQFDKVIYDYVAGRGYKSSLMKKIVNSSTSLYKNEHIANTSVMSSTGIGTTRISKKITDFYILRNNRIFSLKKQNAHAILESLFKENEEFNKKIKAIPISVLLTERRLVRLITDYNNLIKNNNIKSDV